MGLRHKSQNEESYSPPREDLLQKACSELFYTAIEMPPREIKLKIFYIVEENSIYFEIETSIELREKIREEMIGDKDYDDYDFWITELLILSKKLMEAYKIKNISFCSCFVCGSDKKPILFREFNYTGGFLRR